MLISDKMVVDLSGVIIQGIASDENLAGKGFKGNPSKHQGAQHYPFYQKLFQFQINSQADYFFSLVENFPYRIFLVEPIGIIRGDGTCETFAGKLKISADQHTVQGVCGEAQHLNDVKFFVKMYYR